MLKKYFISMLGALTAIWITFMLLLLLGMCFAIGSIATAMKSSKPMVAIEKNTILELNLSGTIEEQEDITDVFAMIQSREMPQTLGNIVGALDAAGSDRKVAGLYIRCNGASAGLATREAIRNAVMRFSRSGKWVVAYGDAYTQGDYYVASAANEMFLNPIGEVDLQGLASGIPFFKGLLDKIGVEMQIVKVGTFKSAVEPYTLTHMSEANRLQMSQYLDNIWNRMTDDMAQSRGVTAQSINTVSDSIGALMPAEAMVEAKLIDGLKYVDEMEEYLKGKIGKKADDDLNLVSLSDYLSSGVEEPNTKNEKNKIAVYYACGDITESEDEGIASDRVVPDILDLADDDDIEALVLRVNSGGGSAFASEQIWHALEVFKQKGKRFYVSMGDVAASGGYYISCGAEKIYAEPLTLTGSIGIFGMIPCFKTLVSDKLGVNIDYVRTNANSAGINSFEPLTPFQRSRLQSRINAGYELFTQRCAEGRHISQDSIKAIAQGRVWDGMEARRIGLVDVLGSLNEAIDDLAKEMGYDKYQIVNYPDNEQSFLKMLMSFDAAMRVSAVKEQMGVYYPVFEQVQKLGRLDPVQARMETVILNP